MPSFECSTCGQSFSLPDATLAKYPGWTPRQCRACKASASGAVASRARRSRGARRPRVEEHLTLDQVLDRYTEGPSDGVFTDGSADPNPGPGGWGAVYVRDGEVIARDHGAEAHTTNNRMELTALIAGYGLVPAGVRAVVWTDSKLCVDTITSWAPRWAAAGWKRKGGEIANLDLVQQLYALHRARGGELELRWIKAHNGSRWNEYADSLATAYARAQL